MLGSGFGLYSVEAFKRNKKRRKQHTPFSKKMLISKGRKLKRKFPKATRIQLLAIRERMKKQNRKDRDTSIVSFTLAFVLVLGVFLVTKTML
ncbi:MAG: hypothetical protein AAF611_00950 [Bacteroidota bacterium]